MSVLPFGSRGYRLGDGSKGLLPAISANEAYLDRQYQIVHAAYVDHLIRLTTTIFSRSDRTTNIENIKNDFQKLAMLYATVAKITMIAAIITAVAVAIMLPAMNIPLIIAIAVISLFAYDMHTTSKNIKESLAGLPQPNSADYQEEAERVLYQMIDRSDDLFFKNTICLQYIFKSLSRTATFLQNYFSRR